jgi:hypothetical protein
MSDAYTPPLAMRCAVIRGGVVVNIIVAMPTDLPPPNCIFICGIPEYVMIGTAYDPESGFKEPSVEDAAK